MGRRPKNFDQFGGMVPEMTSTPAELRADKPAAPAARFKSCQTCRHWLIGIGGISGNCHRYAPAPSSSYGLDKTWPVTAASDWCGDFQEHEISAG